MGRYMFVSFMFLYVYMVVCLYVAMFVCMSEIIFAGYVKGHWVGIYLGVS